MKPLTDIILPDIYRALGQQNLFAICSRIEASGYKVEQAANLALADTLTKAETLIVEQLAIITLASLAPANSLGLLIIQRVPKNKGNLNGQ